MTTLNKVADSRSPLKPGIWLLTIVNVLGSGFGIFASLPAIFDTSAHWYSSTGAITSVLVASLFAVILVAACGTWSGRRLSRAGLLVSLAALCCWSALDLVLGFSELRSYGYETGRMLASAKFWTDAALRLIPSVWFGLNAWYLLGPRARDHFGSASTSTKN